MTLQEKLSELLRSIIDSLFPHHHTSPWPLAPYTADKGEEVARVTDEVLAEVIKSFASNKTSGPNGIPNVAIEVAVNVNPDMFRTTIQRCIEQGILPDV